MELKYVLLLKTKNGKKEWITEHYIMVMILSKKYSVNLKFTMYSTFSFENEQTWQ